jgi:imidazolonepropionase-like amidohydrolase
MGVVVMSRIVFGGANLIDGKHPPRPSMTVVVEGNRIVDVRPDAAGPAAGDVVHDVAGASLMPGMVLCHFHFQFQRVGEGGQHGFYTGSERPPGVQMAVCINTARTALRSGFTGVVSAGCSDDLDAQLKMAIAEGLCEGPRMVAASHILESTGYEGETVPWWREPSSTGTYLFADGPDELRKAVRREIRRGAEIIKMQPTAGHGYPSSTGQGSFGGFADQTSHRVVKLQRDEVAAVVQAAHDKGKKVRAHLAYRDHILECIELGVDVIDHADEIDEEIIEAMAARGTFWTPSIVYLRRLIDAESAPADKRQAVQRDYDNVCKMLPVADEAGVKIVMGDDWGIPGLMPHEVGAYVEELQLYQRDAGIPPADLLRWATVHGAQLLGHTDLGSIEPGNLADLLVVDGDPTADLSCLRDPDNRLKAILKDGVFVKNELAS